MSFYARVKYIDRGFANLMIRVRGLTSLHGRVGLLNNDPERIHPLRNDLTVGEVALINEFGSRNAGVPQRSFLRRTLSEKMTEIKERLASAAWHTIFLRETGEQSLGSVAKQTAVDVRQTILRGDIPPPLADFTVMMKGHDRTLQDTLTLVTSITGDVVRGSTVEDADEVAIADVDGPADGGSP